VQKVNNPLNSPAIAEKMLTEAFFGFFCGKEIGIVHDIHLVMRLPFVIRGFRNESIPAT
jgi:hypothetical protein